MDAQQQQNLINLADIDPARSIYRIFKLARLRDAIGDKQMALMPPSTWEDPFENLLTLCCIEYREGEEWKQDFFDAIRLPMFAQCWSLAQESDAMWRAYSRVRTDDFTGRNLDMEHEVVMVRTTVKGLLTALWEACGTDSAESCFLGQVEYRPREGVVSYFEDEIRHERLRAFEGGRGHARSLLIKRKAFKHEEEVRLIYVGRQAQAPSTRSFVIPIRPNVLFEEIYFDPRLTSAEVENRKAQFQAVQFKGRMAKAELYQKIALSIII